MVKGQLGAASLLCRSRQDKEEGKGVVLSVGGNGHERFVGKWAGEEGGERVCE